ncbi:MAG: acetyl-coenzyme A synthetase N-terminal domain-containing protein, partial [Actinomycetes bacterium]
MADHRATRLLTRVREPSLDGLQARATTDPAWFWGEAVADLELAWQRPWSSVLDVSAGIELARWWGGGAFDHAAAVLARWSAAGLR